MNVLFYISQLCEAHKILITVLGIAFIYYEIIYCKTGVFSIKGIEVIAFLLLYEFATLKQELNKLHSSIAMMFLYGKAQADKYCGRVSSDDLKRSAEDRYEV